MKATESTEGDGLTHRVIGAAMEVHRLLGPGLLESIYEEALCHEFGLRGIRFERQKPVDAHYKDVVIQGQRLDLLVNGRLIVELKSVSALPGAQDIIVGVGAAASGDPPPRSPLGSGSYTDPAKYNQQFCRAPLSQKWRWPKSCRICMPPV